MHLHSTKLNEIDVLGIGFGPSNIALAIALEESGSMLSVRFIDRARKANWHPHMLLDSSDIQNNPLRDLVTPRNPKSHYSFVNFLKCEDRLFDYLNLGLLYPLRKEYARYVIWTASFFDSIISYDTRALSIDVDEKSDTWHVETTSGPISARALVLGCGRSRNIPEIFRSHVGKRVFHLTDYLDKINTVEWNLNRIAVLGASQSAVEINDDLMTRFPDLEIHAVHRGFAMPQKDTSPFSEHVYFPEFVEYFYNIDNAGRADLQKQLRRTNYGATDIDVLHKLYVRAYEERLDGKHRFHIHNNTEIEEVRTDNEIVWLSLCDRFMPNRFKLAFDAVVLATGFRDLGVGEGQEPFPALLQNVAPDLARHPDGVLKVSRDYRVQSVSGLPLYLNGLCESSHGFGDAGSFSLLSLRSLDIASSLERHFREGIGDRHRIPVRASDSSMSTI